MLWPSRKTVAMSLFCIDRVYFKGVTISDRFVSYYSQHLPYRRTKLVQHSERPEPTCWDNSHLIYCRQTWFNNRFVQQNLFTLNPSQMPRGYCYRPEPYEFHAWVVTARAVYQFASSRRHSRKILAHKKIKWLFVICVRDMVLRERRLNDNFQQLFADFITRVWNCTK